MNRFVLLAGACAALAACNSDTTPKGDDASGQKGAQGEVLGGTISDAMIPLDTVTSQSPPLKVAPTAGNGEGGDTAAATGENPAPGGAEAVSEPAAPAEDDVAAEGEEAGE